MGEARLLTTVLVLMGCLVGATAFASDETHTVEMGQTVHAPDEGLLIVNGDLSCSVYQTADDLVFRLGKGDAWDRRLQLEGHGGALTRGGQCVYNSRHLIRVLGAMGVSAEKRPVDLNGIMPA